MLGELVRHGGDAVTTYEMPYVAKHYDNREGPPRERGLARTLLRGGRQRAH